MEQRGEGGLPHGNRKFYDLPTPGSGILDDGTQESVQNQENQKGNSLSEITKQTDLLSYISSNIIGREKTFSGPFGLRKGKRES